MRVLYFSGTGNSFYVAKRIADALSPSVLKSIPALLMSGATSVEDAEIVIVSPVYFYSLPPAVARFVDTARFDGVRYLSVVLTAEFPNGLALGQAARLIRAKGLEPNSLFYVRMPTNYVLKSKMLADSAIEDVLAAADRKTDRIAQVISDGRSIKERDSNIYAMITRAHAYKDQWESDFLGFDSGFTSSDSCNACGNCEKFCPFGNITVSQRPRWNGHCEACLRCINICPKHAIQYGALTEGRRRYFNPRVSIRDLG